MNFMKEFKKKIFKVMKLSFKITFSTLVIHKLILIANNDLAFKYTKNLFKFLDKVDDKYKSIVFSFLLYLNLFPKFPKNELEDIFIDSESLHLFGRKFKYPFSIGCDIFSNVSILIKDF